MHKNKPKRYTGAPFATLLCLIVVLYSGEARAETISRHAPVMGTNLEMTVSVDDAQLAEKAFKAVVKEFERIESVMSEWTDESHISKINQGAGSSKVVVPNELINVILAALQVSLITDGAFDITWAVMHGLWDFREGHERIPTKEELSNKLPLVDYRDVVVNARSGKVFLKKPGMAIGLGGIAKGYTVDIASYTLSQMGIENSIVRAGGDIRVQGSSEEGPWNVGIRDPRDKEHIIYKLPLTDISISTSGDYERFFMRDGVRYHHIIDPKTGYPAKGSSSVTIIAPDTMTSDALSTAVFVLGPGRGLELVEKLGGIEAIIVDAAGEVFTSTGIDLN